MSTINKRKIDDKTLLENFKNGMSGIQQAELFGCSPAAVCKRLSRLAARPPKAPRAIDALTTKQAAVIKTMIKTGKTATAAVLDHYETNSRESARQIALKVMESPKVQLALSEEMARAGLTREYRVNKLAELCDHPEPGIALSSLKTAFQLADEFPAVKSKNMNLNLTAQISPVCFDKYQ